MTEPRPAPRSPGPGPAGARSWAWLARLPGWTWDVAPPLGLGVVLALILRLDQVLAPPGAAVVAVAVVVLLARRRLPRTVLAITGGLTFAGLLGQVSLIPLAGLATMVALYTVDTRCTRAWSLAATAVALGGALLASGLAARDDLKAALGVAFAQGVMIVALWVLGDNLRVRRAYVAGLEERAVWVDAQREAEARRAAEAERSRIARELHDVVAHHVAVMAVQAGAARMLSDTIDPRTRDLLSSIEDSAHQAMSELRRLLGVLRREQAGPGPGGGGGGGELAPPPAPQPGLGQLDQLIDQVRQAGLPVELTVAGDAGRLAADGLPGSVDLSAYRIVQEALTNVLKHAGPAPTRVCLRRRRGEITLTITNQAGAGRGPAAAPPGDRPGHGLIGMRERAGIAGGELRAGPTPEGGFEVFARLPAVDAAQLTPECL